MKINMKSIHNSTKQSAGKQRIQLKACFMHYWLAEELDGQEPGVTAEGPVLAAAGADAVVDVGDVRRDVLDACVVKTVDPQTWVPALHLALQVVEGPRRVLRGRVEETKVSCTLKGDTTGEYGQMFTNRSNDETSTVYYLVLEMLYLYSLMRNNPMNLQKQIGKLY